MQKITLIGNMGKDPEERFTQHGVGVISFSVAVNWGKEKTVWYDIAIWENKKKLFERILPHLGKGSRICIIGTLHPPEIYSPEQGFPRVRLRIDPDSINFVGVPMKKDEESPQQAALGTEGRDQMVQEEIPF